MKKYLLVAICLSFEAVPCMEIVSAIRGTRTKCNVIVDSDRHSFVTVNVITPEGVFPKRGDYRMGAPFLLNGLPGIKQISIDEMGTLIFTGQLPDFLKVFSVFDIDVNSVSCTRLQLTAPKVSLQGESIIPEFFANITGLVEDSNMTIYGALLSGHIKINGRKTFNKGKITFIHPTPEIGLETTSDFANKGEVSGRYPFVLMARALSNHGSFTGNKIGFCADVLDNQGEIGNENAYLKFTIQQRMLHTGSIIGKEAHVLLLKQDTFLNSNIFQVQKLIFDGPSVFINKGVASIARLFGSARIILNCGRMDSPQLSLTAELVKNHGFMRLLQLTIGRSFLNQSEKEEAAVFLSERGIKRINSTDIIENTRMINTDLSIPREKVLLTRASTLNACCQGGYIVNTRTGFWPFDVFNLELLKTFADFYIFVENQGDNVVFSLFHNGIEAFSKSFSMSDFDGFEQSKGDFFHLYRHSDNIACHVFNPAYDIWYDFLFDFKGNLQLSLNGESTTGDKRGVKYAFHTNGTITNKNPLAFDSLILDARSLCNTEILKVKNYFFRYMYRYNSGILDLKREHSANTRIALYRDKTFILPAPVPFSFRANCEDNYGITIGDDSAYYGTGSAINFYGVTLLNGVNFLGEGNIAKIQDAIYDVSGSMSGKLDSLVIKSSSNSPSSVIIGQLSLSPMRYLESGGILLMREPSNIRARNLFLSGMVSSSSPIDITYGQMVGNGTIVSSDSLILRKQMAFSSFPDDVKTVAPRIVKKHEAENEERVLDGNRNAAEGFLTDLTKQMMSVRKGSEILEKLEAESARSLAETFAEHGSTNQIFLDLKKAGLEPFKIVNLLALPYFYASFDADLHVLRLHENILGNPLGKNVISMFQKAILCRTNLEILSVRFPDYFRDFCDSWKKAKGRRGNGVVLGLGIEKFVTFVEREGVQKIVGIAVANTPERQRYISTFDYMKRIIEENLNR